MGESIKSRKVIWVINHYAGAPKYGMEYRHYYLAKYWKKAGYTVIIFSASFQHLLSEVPKTFGNFTLEDIDGISYLWVKTSVYKKNNFRRVINMIQFMLKLWWFRPKNFYKPDVIIASSPHPLVALSGYRFAKKYKAKFIFEVRDLWPLTLIEIGGISCNNPLVKILSWIESFAYRKSDVTVSLLPKAKEYMKKHNLDERKFVYIPNGIDLKEFDSKTECIPDRHKRVIRYIKGKNKFIVGYIGSFTISNGLFTMLNAAKIVSDRGLKNVVFILVGKGEIEKSLRDKCKEYGLKNVVFLSPVKKNQVRDFLLNIDIAYKGMIKSPMYSFGMSSYKLLDYMAAGIPIIHSVDEATNDVVKEANCGFSIPAEDHIALADIVMKVSKISKSELRQLGINGRRWVEKYYTYKNLAEKYEKLF